MPSAMVPAIDAALRRHPPGTPQHGGLLLERAQARVLLGDDEGALADCRLALATEGIAASVAAVATIAAARSLLRLNRVEEYESVEQQLAALPPIVVGHNLELWTDVRLVLIQEMGSPPDRLRHLMQTAPRFTRVNPPPEPSHRLLRASLAFGAGDVAVALAEVEEVLALHLDVGVRANLYNLGALAIAVLDDRSRLAEAERWIDEAILMAHPDGDTPSLALRDTRAAVAAVGGAGAAAVADLEAGLGHALEHLSRLEVAWSHAFLARAQLDARHLDAARRHLAAVDAADVAAPVAERVRADLDALDPHGGR